MLFILELSQFRFKLAQEREHDFVQNVPEERPMFECTGVKSFRSASGPNVLSRQYTPDAATLDGVLSVLQSKGSYRGML